MSLQVISKRCEIAKTSREVLTGRALLHRQIWEEGNDYNERSGYRSGSVRGNGQETVFGFLRLLCRSVDSARKAAS